MALELATVVENEIGEFVIPRWVKDLSTFRRWVEEDDEFDFGRVVYLKGMIYIDMGKEQLYTHNAVKTVVTSVLHQFVVSRRLGRYFSDGVLLTNIPADVSNQPDGTFIARETFLAGRVKDVPSPRDGGYVELEGAPDLVVEIVSPSSIRKDKKRLREAYWEAGIPEYWLIDARQEPLQFDILRATLRGYSATRKSGGWVKSAALGTSFRLNQSTDEFGRPEYALEVR